MIEAIKKKYDLPSALLTQILKSNPTAARSAEVDKALDERLIPLTEYQREEIKEALVWVSEKEELEWRMGYCRNSRDYALSQLLDLYLNDPEVENGAALFTSYLQPDKWQEDRFALAELKAAEGSYEDAISLLEGFANYFKVNAEQQAELNQLVAIYGWKQTLANGGTLTESEWMDVELWAENSSAHVAVVSSGMLPLTADRWVPLYDEEGVEKRSADLQGTSAITTSKLYPNPTVGLATLRLRGKALNALSIEILDATGKTIVSFGRSNNAQELFMEVTDLSLGVYTIALKDKDDNLIETLLLIKQ